MTTATDDIMTISELAKWLKVERHMVSKMVEDGKLPFIRLGPRSIRFIRSEIMRALADRSL